MGILRIVDDHIKLHDLGLDQELQKYLGPDWTVEYYHATRREIKRVFPETGGDPFGFEKDEEIFFLWNYFWTYMDDVQKIALNKVQDMITRGARIKFQIYTCYGDYSEDDEELASYKKFFDEGIVLDYVSHIMHKKDMISDWAKSEAEAIKKLY